MIVKQTNTIISLVGRVIHILIIFYVAVLLGKFVWWVFSPSNSDVYVETTSINAFDNSAKFIINRNPFGVVVAPPVPPRPSIASEMKLTGLYVNTPENSIAFYEYNHKSYIAKIGDTIGGTAILKSISTNGIVISQNDVEANVDLTGGAGTAIIIPANNTSTSNFLNNQQSQVIPGSDTSSNSQPNANNSQQSNVANPQSEDLAERRRKLIEEFQKRNFDSGANSNSSAGNSSGNAGANDGNVNNP